MHRFGETFTEVCKILLVKHNTECSGFWGALKLEVLRIYWIGPSFKNMPSQEMQFKSVIKNLKKCFRLMTHLTKSSNFSRVSLKARLFGKNIFSFLVIFCGRLNKFLCCDSEIVHFLNKYSLRTEGCANMSFVKGCPSKINCDLC